MQENKKLIPQQLVIFFESLNKLGEEIRQNIQPGNKAEKNEDSIKGAAASYRIYDEFISTQHNKLIDKLKNASYHYTKIDPNIIECNIIMSNGRSLGTQKITVANDLYSDEEKLKQYLTHNIGILFINETMKNIPVIGLAVEGYTANITKGANCDIYSALSGFLVAHSLLDWSKCGIKIDRVDRYANTDVKHSYVVISITTAVGDKFEVMFDPWAPYYDKNMNMLNNTKFAALLEDSHLNDEFFKQHDTQYTLHTNTSEYAKEFLAQYVNTIYSENYLNPNTVDNKELDITNVHNYTVSKVTSKEYVSYENADDINLIRDLYNKLHKYNELSIPPAYQNNIYQEIEKSIENKTIQHWESICSIYSLLRPDHQANFLSKYSDLLKNLINNNQHPEVFYIVYNALENSYLKIFRLINQIGDTNQNEKLTQDNLKYTTQIITLQKEIWEEQSQKNFATICGSSDTWIKLYNMLKNEDKENFFKKTVDNLKERDNDFLLNILNKANIKDIKMLFDTFGNQIIEQNPKLNNFLLLCKMLTLKIRNLDYAEPSLLLDINNIKDHIIIELSKKLEQLLFNNNNFQLDDFIEIYKNIITNDKYKIFTIQQVDVIESNMLNILKININNIKFNDLVTVYSTVKEKDKNIFISVLKNSMHDNEDSNKLCELFTDLSETLQNEFLLQWLDNQTHINKIMNNNERLYSKIYNTLKNSLDKDILIDALKNSIYSVSNPALNIILKEISDEKHQAILLSSWLENQDNIVDIYDGMWTMAYKNLTQRNQEIFINKLKDSIYLLDEKSLAWIIKNTSNTDHKNILQQAWLSNQDNIKKLTNNQQRSNALEPFSSKITNKFTINDLGQYSGTLLKKQKTGIKALNENLNNQQLSILNQYTLT